MSGVKPGGAAKQGGEEGENGSKKAGSEAVQGPPKSMLAALLARNLRPAGQAKGEAVSA